MVKEKKFGLTDQFMKEIIIQDKKMEKGNFFGEMEVVMKVLSKTMK